MSPALLDARDIHFSWPSATTPLFSGFSCTFPIGFTGVVGPNGAGKTTLLRLLTGELSPGAGHVSGAGLSIYCSQRTDHPPEGFADMLADTGAPVYQLRGTLGIEFDWESRWQTLSHGQRKRAQIGVALWQQPDVLALDEPSNHLDKPARAALVRALETYRGIGVLVSHDRALLDQLCDQCIWADGPATRAYPGGYSALESARAMDQATAIRERNKAKRAVADLQRAVQTRRQHHDAGQKHRSKRHLAPKDRSAKAAVDLRRVTDSKEGSGLRQLEGRMAQAQRDLQSHKVSKTHAVAIELPGELCQRSHVLALEAGSLSLGDGIALQYPNLAMKPAARVALVGDNGSGKSSLLDHLVKQARVDADRLLYLPQETEETDGQMLIRDIRRLPKAMLGHAMSVVNCLGSRPDKLLASDSPSPGETRKLVIALGMTRRPHLMVLDEPTNHLDLPSIAALEQALADCRCGLLMVSHDARFIDALTHITWQIQRTREGLHVLDVS